MGNFYVIRFCHFRIVTLFFFCLFFINAQAQTVPINFSQSTLSLGGLTTINGATAMEFGPDGRLYVSDYSGTSTSSGVIKALTIQRNGPTSYVVTAVENLTGAATIPNHNDNGTPAPAAFNNRRQVTGLTVAGTAANPIVYVTSSDVRIGGGTGSGTKDVGLDTNSGVITRMTWNGSTWQVVDIVRGLPRSEENHATNGLEFATINGTDYLIVTSGGFTNAGAPSSNFALITEYALAAAVLSVNLTQINSLPILNDNGRSYIYDLPTLDDPTRPNANGINDPDAPGYNGIDVNDPWGGNDGLNQAKLVQGGPVQIFSPGYRNTYDLVLTQSGALYVTDNGANGGWGGFPENEGTGNATNNYLPSEPGSQSPSGGEQIDNIDHLELVTNNIQNYTFGSFYAGHPNPIRANPAGAGLYTDNSGLINGTLVTTGAPIWRTQLYDPDGSRPGSTTDPNVGLPADWPPVPLSMMNPVEGDWRGPTVPNPDGPNDNPIVIWGTNTNGITEYRASNFGNAMQGNLLATHSGGNLRRVQLNANGTSQQLTQNFLSTGGGFLLGITANGDEEVFPGTIWVGSLTGAITVFEPQDFVVCIQPGEPGYSALADYDNDGYTNQDEIDNGTDPCNGGSQPQDFDKILGAPFISDLNDPDDDGDGIPDALDPMQLGNPLAVGSQAFALPIYNDLFNDQQGLGGIFGLGMTGLMNNGSPNPNWLNMLDRRDDPNDPNPNDVLGGAPGLMTSHMTSGTALGTTNSQDKGYQYGVRVSTATGPFTVTGGMVGFTGPLRLYGNTAAVGGELGFQIGDGTQSNYIKFVVTTNGFMALQEINDVPQTPLTFNLPVGSRPTNDILFHFVVNPANGQVSLEYQIDGGTRATLGTITAQGSILNAIQNIGTDLIVGFIGTSNTPGVELEGTWDFLNVVPENNFFATRINAGGPELMHNGEVFSADQNFVGGAPFTNTNAQVPILYQTERTSAPKTFNYDIPVPNGNYYVMLHFAEIYWGVPGNGSAGGVGSRIFDVNIEGSLVLNNYDIFAEVGAQTVVIKTFPVTVSDGQLNIAFSSLAAVGGVDQPKVSAIEVIEDTGQGLPIIVNPIANQTSTIGQQLDGSLNVVASGGEGNLSYSAVNLPPGLFIEPTNGQIGGTIAENASISTPYNVTITVDDSDNSANNAATTNFTWTITAPNPPVNTFALRLNAGGPALTHNGFSFGADQNFVGGNAYVNNSAQVPDLYKTERSSSARTFDYNIPLENGTYNVVLHFAEIYWGATGGGAGGVGKRIFDVTMEGALILDNYDIFAEVGAQTVVTKSYPVTVTDGVLNLTFSALDAVGGVDQPKLSALEVLGTATNQNQAPVAVANATPLTGPAPLEVSFTGSGSTDDNNDIVSYEWDFGNGVTATGVNQSYTFTEPGSYTVTLTVSDGDGMSGTETVVVGVDVVNSCQWNDLAPSSLEKVEAQSAKVGDKLYVIAGFLSGLQITGATEIYDPNTDLWSTGAPIPIPVTHMGIAVDGTDIWVLSGFVGNHPGTATNKVQIYNTVSNSWSFGPDLPAPRGSGAATLNNGKIHYFGGLLPDRVTDVGEHFILDLNNLGLGWVPAAALPNPRNHHSAASVNGLVYAIGGQYGHDNGVLDQKFLDVYNPDNDQWTRLADLPSERSHFEPGTIVHNGKIIIVGGRRANFFFDNITEYNPITNEWSERCVLPQKLLAPVAKVFGDKLIVTNGGINGENFPTNLSRWISIEPEIEFPPLILDPIADQINQIGESSSLILFASGGNPNENVTYAINGQPAGISIEPTNGQIVGNIDSSALNGGPNNDGIYLVTVTATKPGSEDATQQLSWVITSSSSNFVWIDKNENENYTARHENSFVQAGNKFYLMGGRENAKTIDVYDYTSNTWTALTDSAPFEFNHFQATEYKGLIWVIGSFQTNVFPTEVPAEHVWAFDPATNEWIQGPQIPQNRRRGSAGLAVYNDKFYIVAGNTIGHDGGYVNWFDEYDPASGTWTALTNAPRARDHFHTTVIGDKVYAVGGRLSGGTGGVFKPVIPQVDVYDFITSTWSTLPTGQNIPTPRAAPIVVNFNNKLLVIGGEVEDELVYGVNTNDALKITEQYDPATQTWSRLEDLNYERHGTQGIVSGNGIFTLAGSPNLGGGSQKNMEVFGVDAPVGTALIAGTLSAPSSVIIANGTSETIPLQLSGGNVGKFIRSIQLSGPNAADFNIVSGLLTNALLNANSTHNIVVQLNSSTGNKSATLTINYGAASALNVILSNTDNTGLVVGNPGTQNNNEQDVVSLQINATGAGNLTYSATGLPPTLTINPTTGLISGTVSNGGGGSGAFVEQNGLVVVEAESGNTTGWGITNANGATGIIANSNHFNNQNGSTIPYEITISTPGVYRFNWRSFYSGSASTDENDNWLRFPNNNDVWFFGFKGTPASEAALISNLQGAQTNIVFPGGTSRQTAATTPEGSSNNGYLKIYRSGGTSEVYSWQAVTSDFDPHNVYVWFVNPGTYTMEISERSAGHAIDKFALYKLSTYGTNNNGTQFTNTPQSPTGGAGAADNSPYNVTVSVASSGNPPANESIQFIWNIAKAGIPQNGVVSFTLIDADLDVDLFNLSNGQQISSTVTQGKGLNIRANINPAVVGSVTMSLNGPVTRNIIENGAPYALFGDVSGNYNPLPLPLGNYTVSATPYSGLNGTGTAGQTVILQFSIVAGGGGNQPPVAVVSATPLTGNTPLTVNFTGSNSTDDVAVTGYSWNFGDGSPLVTTANPTHTYANAGSYTAALTVTDGGGLQNTETIGITVNAVPQNGVVSFTLIDADLDVDLFNLSNGQQINSTITQGKGLNIRANTNPAVIGSVYMTLSGPVNRTITENVAPYALFGDVSGNYNPLPLPLGNYTVSAIPYSGANRTGTVGQTVTLQFSIVAGGGVNQAPVAVASATPLTGNAPLTVNFTGSNSTDDVAVTGYSWNFGDGSPLVTTANPTHTYINAGVYTVSLTVQDIAGLTNTTSFTVTVNSAPVNQAPVAVVSATPLTGNTPLTVNFTGSNSTDDVAVTGYSWNFGDGSPLVTTANPTHTYTNAGSYTAALTVTDGGGLQNTETIGITVNAVPQNGVVSFTLIDADLDVDLFNLSNGQQINSTINQGKGLNIRANTNPAVIGSVYMTLSGPVNRTITENVAPYALFGDVSGNYNPLPLPLGNYTVSAIPYSGANRTGTVGQTVTLQFSIVAGGGVNQAPVAVASATPLTGNAPLTVNFTGSNSTDDVAVTGYSWNFGDGSPAVTTANPTHTYTNAGSYTAALTVTDGGGLQNTETIGITVNAVPQNGVVSFTLIDADLDVDLFNLSNGQQINSTINQGKGLNIRANTNPAVIGSVYMTLSGPVNRTITENVAPYALFGDVSGNYNPLPLPLGNYTVSAIPYSGANRTGTVGPTATLLFSIVQGNQNKNSIIEIISEEMDLTNIVETEFADKPTKGSGYLFPNPASNQVYVAVEPEIIIKEIAIMDITGRLLKTYFANLVKEYDGLYLIDIYNFEDGVYQVLLTTENEKIFTYKLIVKN